VNAAVTGAVYVDAMNRDATDREFRRAFVNLALTLVPVGGRVFDFGSGPGTDAKHYAGSGLHVGAYDVDIEMCDYFAVNCAAEIASGSVQLNTGPYPDFLRTSDLRAGADVDLIVSNFAPLNLVDDLPPLFAKFATMLGANGQLLVSVLNPFFHLMASGRRWLRFPELLCRGRYTTHLHGVIPVTRWLPGRMARLARPFFELTAIHVPATDRPGQPPKRLNPSGLCAPRNATTQFLFLQFQRNARP